MKKKLFAIFCASLGLMVFALGLTGQDPVWDTHTREGGRTMVSGMATSESDIVLAGVFADSLRFDSETLHSNGGFDLFMAKLSQDGQAEWVLKFGGPFDDSFGGMTLHNGAIYLCGATMDSARYATRFYHPGGSLFINKYSQSGQELWSKLFHFNGKATVDDIKGLENGSLVAVGSFRGSIEIDGQKKSSGKRTASYLMVFNELGQALEFHVSTGSGSQRNIAVATDYQNNLYLLSACKSGTFSVNESMPELMVDNESLVITKLDEKLEMVWNHSINSESFLEGTNIVADRQGNVHVGLNYSGTIFANDLILLNNSQLDAAVLKYDKDGELLAAAPVSGSGYIRLLNMNLDQQDQLLITGYYFDDLNITDLYIEKREERGRSAFLFQLSEKQEVVWSADLDQHLFSYGSAIAPGTDGSLFFAGGAVFGISPGENNEEKIRNPSSFAIKFGGCETLQAGIEISGPLCPGDTITLNAGKGLKDYWWNGMEGSDRLTVFEPGEYLLKVADHRGCEATQKVEIDYAPNSEVWLGMDAVLWPGDELWIGYEDFAGEFYWADGFAEPSRVIQYRHDVDFEDFILFAKGENMCWGFGKIAVEYQHPASFDDESLTATLRVYPVPVKDRLHWVFDNPEKLPFRVELFDSKGLLVFRENRTDNSALELGSINTSHLKEGGYLIKVTTEIGFAFKKVVKID